MAPVTMRVDLTLKTRIRTSIRPEHGGPMLTVWQAVNEEVISRDVVRFMMRLNRYILNPPRSLTKPPRLNAVVVLEYSPTRHRPHLHALIEKPEHVSEERFTEAVRKAWLAQDFAHHEMAVEPIRDPYASFLYNSKQDDAWDRIVYDWRERDERATWRGSLL
jgi:hypothetical protein